MLAEETLTEEMLAEEMLAEEMLAEVTGGGRMGSTREEPVAPDEVTSRPVLRVIRGDATPEEIAALLAVVAARAGGPVAAEPAAVRAAWSNRAALMSRPLMPGPGAWRASAWHR
jgi:hypothetical protein